jgi:hypothetical protein
MHDCRQTKEKLIDLVFDETPSGERVSLFAEMEDCADCLIEYRTMSETLSAFNEANEAAQPPENYWHEYNRALLSQLATTEDAPTIKGTPFWKRLFTSSIPVPVPLAAAAAIVLLISAFIVLRKSVPVITQSAQSASQATTRETIKYVEVPVIKERIVTRTVYVERGGRNAAKNQSESSQPPNNSVAKSNAGPKRSPGVSLEGFQPADEVKLRIIKGSYPDEK